jgi:hypothetical protein
MGRNALLTFIITILTSSVFASAHPGDTLAMDEHAMLGNSYIDFGATAGWHAVRDVETSPLIYRGFMPGAALGFYYAGNKLISEVNYNISYGFLVTRNYPDNDNNRAETVNNKFRANMAWSLHPSVVSGTRYYLGFDVSFLGNFRNNSKFNNASFNYDIIGGLGPIFRFEKDINLLPRQINLGLFRYPFRKRALKLSASLAVPVVSEVLRPSYSTIDDFVNGQSNNINIKQMKLETFHTYFSTLAQFQLFYYLHNQNMLKFAYNWYYFNYYPPVNGVKGVEGSFSLSIVFRLNNNR